MTAVAMDVRERPILMSAPMVRAILDGRKTQTRRVVKPQPDASLDYTKGQTVARFTEIGVHTKSGRSGWQASDVNGWPIYAFHDGPESIAAEIDCPYGAPGDRLWVRENWAIDRCGSRVSLKAEAWPDGWPIDRLVYAADIPLVHLWNQRPSVHMPRWASRLTLEITGVRVERLQEISEADAIAEGVDAVSMAAVPRQATLRRRDDFAQLWDSLNAKRGHPWSSNPWVWVIEFARVAA